MKKYLDEYIKELEGKPSKKVINNMYNKITFFAHERLIHLIVTMFFVLFSLIFTYLCFYTKISYFIIITFILYIIDIFYIFHYYYLENGVQKLYKLYDKYNN